MEKEFGEIGYSFVMVYNIGCNFVDLVFDFDYVIKD